MALFKGMTIEGATEARGWPRNMQQRMGICGLVPPEGSNVITTMASKETFSVPNHLLFSSLNLEKPEQQSRGKK
jgi:hypothetical protein